MPKNSNIGINELSASFDGDADRIVCYYLDADHNFNLIDGDKIAAFYLNYIKTKIHKIQKLQSELPSKVNSPINNFRN